MPNSLTLNGMEIIPDKPDPWLALAHRIDLAYGQPQNYYGDIRNYHYCGKKLDAMARSEVILALTNFKIPTDQFK